MEYERGVEEDARISDMRNWKMECHVGKNHKKNGFVGDEYQQLWFGDVELFSLLDIQMKMLNRQSDIKIWGSGNKRGWKYTYGSHNT